MRHGLTKLSKDMPAWGEMTNVRNCGRSDSLQNAPTISEMPTKINGRQASCRDAINDFAVSCWVAQVQGLTQPTSDYRMSSSGLLALGECRRVPRTHGAANLYDAIARQRQQLSSGAMGGPARAAVLHRYGPQSVQYGASAAAPLKKHKPAPLIQLLFSCCLRWRGGKHVAEGRGPPGQVLEGALGGSFFLRRHAAVDVHHALGEGLIDEPRQLVGRGLDGDHLAEAGGHAPEVGPER